MNVTQLTPLQRAFMALEEARAKLARHGEGACAESRSLLLASAAVRPVAAIIPRRCGAYLDRVLTALSKCRAIVGTPTRFTTATPRYRENASRNSAGSFVRSIGSMRLCSAFHRARRSTWIRSSAFSSKLDGKRLNLPE